MSSPDEDPPTEPERWRDLDMLLSRPGNLVHADFNPSPGVSHLSLFVCVCFLRLS
jgi:ubiquitin-activating enzyme E1 C